MGLFASLFGRKAAFDDHVFRLRPQKYAALTAAAAAALAEGGYPLVVCHFKDQLEEATTLLTDAGVPVVVLQQIDRARLDHAQELVADGRVGVVSAEHMPKPGSGVRRNRSATPVRVLLFEHYPIAAPDDRVLALDRYLAAPVEFHCYTSLEDACVVPYRMEQVRKIIAALGLEEGEELHHPMLTRAIRRAQEKTARAMHSPDHRADSPEEWLETNAAHYRNQRL